MDNRIDFITDLSKVIFTNQQDRDNFVGSYDTLGNTGLYRIIEPDCPVTLNEIYALGKVVSSEPNLFTQTVLTAEKVVKKSLDNIVLFFVVLVGILLLLTIILLAITSVFSWWWILFIVILYIFLGALIVFLFTRSSVMSIGNGQITQAIINDLNNLVNTPDKIVKIATDFSTAMNQVRLQEREAILNNVCG